ncbi:DUF1631 family protein [Pulveribacter suum]|uniref:Peptidase n=1 Tax=Pulveribacter suum TaxID=2116657 RepID=A0A2P1NLN8_9BURK|nr:DUF1631 family protein [Pulveribacter suum]AVP57982.1 peptidase [Pulveribacter suum]
MPLPASRARTVFRACVVNAIRDGETLMGQLLTRTRSALSEEESSSRDVQRRHLVADALRLLNQHEAQLVKAYPLALLEAFADGPAQPRARGPAGIDTGIDFGELALMDDTEVLAQVELARAQQTAALATEAALAELNALVSSAQGLGNVQPERNPLRPENYIRALQQVVGDTGVSGDVRQQWMAQMREQLGQQLVEVYQRTASALREQGVEPVGYAVAGLAGAQRSSYGGYSASAQMGMGGYASSVHSGLVSHYGLPEHGSGWGGGVSGGVPLAPAAEEALLTVGMLRQMLAGLGDPFAMNAVHGGAAAAGGHGAVSGHGGYVTQEAADAMQDLAQLEHLVGRLAGAQGASAWAGTSAMMPASAPVPAPVQQASPERAAQDVVSRMMDNISQDARLLPPMQRAIQSLAPALRELVRHDTRFFSDEQHPARRLLDELTQRSLAFDREDSPSFGRFMRLVNEVVGHLATARIESSVPFERVLRALEKAWETQERHRRERREAKERERQLREQRDLLAERLAADFRRLPNADGAPADLLAFVTGPWAAVVALAQTAEGGDAGGDDDPGGYLALVPLLLAAGQQAQLHAEPERLGQALAAALPTLREGLMSINHPADGIQAAEERLLGLLQLAQDYHHEQQRRAEAARAQEQARAQAEVEAAQAQAHAHAHAHAQAQAQAQADAAQAAAEPPPAEPADSLAAPLSVQDELPTQSEMQALAQEPRPDVPAADDAKGALQIGQWVEIVSQQVTVQTQLTWASPHNTLFLFTGLDGSTQSMTRRMIDKLSGEGAFRRLAGAPAPAAAPRSGRARQR